MVNGLGTTHWMLSVLAILQFCNFVFLFLLDPCTYYFDRVIKGNSFIHINMTDKIYFCKQFHQIATKQKRNKPGINVISICLLKYNI